MYPKVMEPTTSGFGSSQSGNLCYSPRASGSEGQETLQVLPRVNIWPAACGVQRGYELPDEREIQPSIQSAVEVVLWDQVFEREVVG
jgi:hypothetical protein